GLAAFSARLRWRKVAEREGYSARSSISGRFRPIQAATITRWYIGWYTVNYGETRPENQVRGSDGEDGRSSSQSLQSSTAKRSRLPARFCSSDCRVDRSITCLAASISSTA